MKLLYLSTWDFSNEKTDGVCKKMLAQVKVFENAGHQVDFIYIKDGVVIYKEKGINREIATVGNIKKTVAYLKMYRHIKKKKYDWIYNRYGMMDAFYFRVLKRLFQNGARIMIEIPAYPYQGERTEGFLQYLMFKWDQWYWGKLKTIVEIILTYSKHETIFGIPTMQIMNGLEVDKVHPISEKAESDDTVDLLIVANMQKHHGCERLLYGLKDYYSNGGERKILCHFVGEGIEKPYYESIVKEEQLSNNVIFYGAKSGEGLEEIYEKADIGICSLGCYKKNAFVSSELKSREYLAKGLPIITGVTIDLFEKNRGDYYLEFENNPENLNINTIIAFYDQIYASGRTKQQVICDIRNYAKDFIDIKNVMADVLNKIDGQNKVV